MEQFSTHSLIARTLFLFLLMFQLFCIIWGFSNETDKLSLLEFKAKIESDPLSLLRTWNDSVQFCFWPGVTCSRRHLQRVTVLDVSGWQLEGQLSPHIGNLSFLRVLNLANNSFNSEIPPEIGRLSRLESLNILNNTFSGEIPANLSHCSSLWFLRMVRNNLSGRIPEEIGLLSKLQFMELSLNNLVGEIPRSIGNLSSLTSVYLGYNYLDGTIPYTIGELKSLRYLVLGSNNLSGNVPLSIYNLSTLEYISMFTNRLGGTLPANLGHTLPNLQTFYLRQNYFAGHIPASLSNASNLIQLDISKNNFSGNVPSFASSSNLVSLGISTNNLGYARNGDLNFLRSLVNMTNLMDVGFVSNNLGGSIPDAICNLTSTRLRQIVFGRNQITGEIPSGIGNLVSLQSLGMEVNFLSGPIPTTIGMLKKMSFLTLFRNKLSGTIPSTLRNLTSLSKLDTSQNNIHGSIPASLGECKSLQGLSLAENNLSGAIPSQLVSLSSLTLGLILSRNRLNGSIPSEVGKLVQLGVLDISENELSGEVPKAFGSCTSMEYLYLQGNSLRGLIPDELNSMRGVQIIDLSRNNLSGQIPTYLGDFQSLRYLNLSFNEFEGPVPLDGIFKNKSAFSIIGNTRLCGGIAELKLPKCPIADKKHKLSSTIKLVVIVACSIAGLILMTLLIMLSIQSHKRRKKVVEPSTGISLPRVSYGDLSNATNGFSSENLIGVGSFGSVYKGIILDQDERRVAVKVLNLNISRAIKTFLAECESLRIVRHRNLVKLVTVCSSIDFQGNDFKAIVYEFMENGNLEEWLHSARSTEQGQTRQLTLIQRIDIAIDVASALDYLHNHGPESIAHCDIKPSNILLDGEMVAHVGDFGVAKLLKSVISSTNQTSSTGVRGTVGYIAPEYAIGNEISTSGDVYSYGILLLEMFTGKRPTDTIFKDDFTLNNFASIALSERVIEIADPVLLEENEILGSDDQDEMVGKSFVSIMEIGIACSSKYPSERRSIGDVAAELCKIRDAIKGLRTNQNRVFSGR